MADDATLHPFFAGEAAYQDPTQQRVESGNTVAQVLATRVMPIKGLKGVIVPPATPGGVPHGFNPHAINQMSVNLVEAMEGSPAKSTPLMLGSVTPERMQAAIAEAARRMPMPRTPQETQARAALAMQLVAAPLPADGQLKQAKVQSRGPVQPLAVFAGPSQPALGHNGDAPPVAHYRPPPQPTVQVTYEGPGFGMLPAVYHAVIQEPGFIVLVHDLAWVSPPYFPPSSGVAVGQLGFYVQGDDEAHIVESTGVEYTYDGKRFCVLSIVDSRPVAQE